MHYTQNPFVDDEYIQMAKDRKKYDYDNYLRLTLGKWGEVGGLIYNNYTYGESSKGYEYYTMGADFGFNNPSCVLLIGWLDNEPYVIDEVYESHLINHQLITKTIQMLRMHNLNPNSIDTLFCDSAEPDRIQEWCDYGFNAVGSIKDVNAKINSVKATKLHIAERCANTIKEIESYSYQKDKDGNDTDKPIKFNDHSMDALGYCIYGTVGILSPFSNQTEYVNIYTY